MKRTKKVIVYILAAILSFLIIPEILIRTLSGEALVSISTFASLGGLYSPLLALIIFFAVSSLLFGVLAVYVVSRIYRAVKRDKGNELRLG